MRRLPSVRAFFATVILMFVALGIARPSSAEPLNNVPPDLAPWIGWVTDRHPEWRCAVSGGAPACVWPGRATFRIEGDRGAFELIVTTLKEELVPLPATAGLFPSNIVVRSQSGEVAAPLMRQNGELFVKLAAGSYQIRGDFLWDKVPSEIPAPALYGIIDVRDSGNKELGITRTGPVFRLSSTTNQDQIDSLQLEVIRRIRDGSPLIVESLLRLQVSGAARELALGKVTPLNSAPLRISSPLAYSLSANGELTLQLLPGIHDVQIDSAVAQPVTELATTAPAASEWPAEELWIWVPSPELRTVEIQDATPMSVELKELPEGWREGSAYVVAPTGKLVMNERRRGAENEAPNVVNLSRSFWIDIAGSGMTVVDKFTGQLNRDFRLNALPELNVGRAGGPTYPHLISKDPDGKGVGVELRERNLNLEVVSRLESKQFSAVGWRLTADTLSGIINLPPGWRLLDILGATEVPGSWVDSWNLFSIYLSILLFFATFKLFGRVPALIFGISLLINHGEFLAPMMLYLDILVLVTLARLLSSRGSAIHLSLQTLLLVTWAAWAFQGLAFSKLQFTQFLFPQLAAGTRYDTIIQSVLLMMEQSLFGWPMILAGIFISIQISRWAVKGWSPRAMAFRGIILVVVLSVVVTLFGGLFGSMSYTPRYYNAAPQAIEDGYDGGGRELTQEILGSAGTLRKGDISALSMQSARKQGTDYTYKNKTLLSGPAVPSWRWRSNSFTVSGPVPESVTLRPILLSPFFTRALSLLRVLLMLVLIVMVAKRILPLLPSLKLPHLSKASPAIVMLGVISSLLFAPLTARADFPSEEMLHEVESRLLQKRCQRERCAIIESATFVVSDTGLKLSLSVISEGSSTVMVPGPLQNFSPRTTLVDGVATTALRQNNGYLEILIPTSGKHRVEIEGPLPAPSSFALQIADPPLRATVEAPNWVVEGLAPTGLVQDTLGFVKRSDNEAAETLAKTKKEESSSSLPAWIVVKRSITIAEKVSAQLVVSRLGDTQDEASVKFALLPGERVVSGNGVPSDDLITVRFNPGEDKISLTTSLPELRELTLTARPIPFVSEEWSVRCSALLACTVEGLTPTSFVSTYEKEYRWLPFPDETATIKSTVLEGIPGDFVTIDTVDHRVTWGTNLLNGTLTLSLRVTKPFTLPIKVASGGEITSVGVNGSVNGSTWKGENASVPFEPGSHSLTMAYTLPWSAALFERFPAVDVGAKTNNLHLRLTPSPDRWIVWTGGTTWGPCVVYWPKLILIVAICVLLARFGMLPCSQLSAGLLGLGLASLPLIFFWPPLAWLALLKLSPHPVGDKMNLPRMVAVLTLTVAAIVLLYVVVRTGLILEPPMLITGNSSTASLLHWFTDFGSSLLPQPWVISLPLWWWRVVALVWSIWLVVALKRWLVLTIDALRSRAAQE